MSEPQVFTGPAGTIEVVERRPGTRARVFWRPIGTKGWFGPFACRCKALEDATNAARMDRVDYHLVVQS